MPTQFMKLGFEDRVIREDGFHNIELNGKRVGFQLDIRINYYRGFSLSNVDRLELKINGEQIPNHLMLLELNGKQFSLDQLKEVYTEYWGIKQAAHLRVFNYGYDPGEYDVELTLVFKSPYMMFAPGVFGMIDSSAKKQMIIGEGREFA